MVSTATQSMKGEIKSNFHDAITNTKARHDCFLVCYVLVQIYHLTPYKKG